MNGQLAAVHIVGLVTQEVKKLGVYHRNQEVKGRIRIRHDEKQGRFLVAQRVQFQLIVHGEVAQFLDVEWGKPSTTGNEDGFCRFARDKLSRTFSSNSQKIHKKGARSTVWLLTPRLIDYIFPFSRSLQRYA